MKRNYVIGIVCVICALALITGIVIFGKKKMPNVFTNQGIKYLPALSELVDDPNAPKEIGDIARATNRFLPQSAKNSAVWKHYTITDTVTISPQEIENDFVNYYKGQRWKSAPEEVEMPEEALTGNWMSWYRPSSQAISVTVLIVIPEEIEEEKEKVPGSGDLQPLAKHVIVGRWAVPQD